MSKIKRTLIVVDHYPLPENTGGKIRTMNFARYFRKYGSVEIAYSELPSEINAGESFFNQEYYLERIDFPRNSIGHFGDMMRGLPYPIRKYSNAAKELILSLINTNNYDYLLIRYSVNAYCFFQLPTRFKKRIILDFDDILTGSRYRTLFYDSKNLFKKVTRSLNRIMLGRYERRCLDLNISLFCSEEDIQRMKGYSNKMFVAPNVYSSQAFEEFDFGNGFRNGKKLLFVGTLSYNPNFEGLKWFIQSIYPKLKQKHPDLKLMIVGHNDNPSEKEVRECCEKAKDIELSINIVDIRDYYKRCSAVVVPILGGGGTRIKILEAALAGRPVLSTHIGAEGLCLKNEKNVLLFKDAADFFINFNKILNEESYNALTKSAKEVVLKHYSSTNFSRAMNNVLLEIDRNA